MSNIVQRDPYAIDDMLDDLSLVLPKKKVSAARKLAIK